MIVRNCTQLMNWGPRCMNRAVKDGEKFIEVRPPPSPGTASYPPGFRSCCLLQPACSFTVDGQALYHRP